MVNTFNSPNYHTSTASVMANTQDLPPTYDAAVTSEVHSSGPFVPAGTGDVKDVKVPMPTPDANASSPGAGPTPFSPPSMPPTTVYNYVNPVTHEVVTSLLPPDHPRMVCLQQGHDPHSKFGFLDVLSDLEIRGLISQVSSPESLRKAIKQRQVVYLGVDPTAKYLHVGHLLPLLCLFHFQVRGHGIIPLIGGATGLVGDPSGRNTERPLSEASIVANNVEHLASGLNRFFEGAVQYASKRLAASTRTISPPEIQNNLNWFRNMGLLDVQIRLNSQQGISFTEFTYQLLQAYDFYTLHKDHSCTIQLGGSDQWGNILAGIDLINKLNPDVASDGSHIDKVFGITMPLLTTPSGEKFGKSAGNAVALDDSITSVFDFYQFFLRVPDSHVGQYLKMFTLLPVAEIEDVLCQHQQNPEARAAQRLLSTEVTELVHGEEAVSRAQAATKVLYERDLAEVKATDIIMALKGDPRLQFCEESELLDAPVAKLAGRYKLVVSNCE
ncbi:hypothetical protein PHLCEN_2v6509 [Hermanssonia centrifuga]|uniref:Tyrosine--tRNA ligase n=1 Tax=Hermanssonia centrifuga TaxID=98765 RepID=A0A2R6NZC0_9APHY|nr:hypothetical protein PHLCEN_2v6509 [Hermanssonia centrifuga]